MRLYVEFGPTGASRRTGIDKSLISRWGTARGLSTVASAKTAEATEMSAARRRLKRLQRMDEIADAVLDSIGRTNEPHVDVIGRTGGTEPLQTAHADVFLQSAASISKNVTMLRRLSKGIAENHGDH